MSYWKPLVPASFAVPPRLEGEGFHLRMLTVNDVVKDYDAPDESVCLGCAYIYPSEKKAYDAKVFWWVRDSALPGGLDGRLGMAIRGWIKDVWPFGRVAYPGRDISWAAWRGEP